ncbi:MAG: protein phosphatase CheZ [Alphaproteobacteria bacterium]|nr:protein phosphatase CheZ [Alphaproteobacteria bacterium]MCK5658679.1 protein phosphatase CheZ [Alphaproteobacteria bacterium]
MDAQQQATAENLKDRAYTRKEVVEIIRTVLGSIDKNNEPTAKLHNELSTLVSYIENMRSELAHMRSIEISHHHIPTAADELDAVIEETASATGTIMDACEKIEKVADSLTSPVSDDLANAVTSIYEACGFQDITGQRITKVVKTLKHIEAKVTEIINAFGHSGEELESKITDNDKKSLLQGPQIGSEASSQDDIDKLLASFD